MARASAAQRARGLPHLPQTGCTRLAAAPTRIAPVSADRNGDIIRRPSQNALRLVARLGVRLDSARTIPALSLAQTNGRKLPSRREIKFNYRDRHRADKQPNYARHEGRNSPFHLAGGGGQRASRRASFALCSASESDSINRSTVALVIMHLDAESSWSEI